MIYCAAQNGAIAAYNALTGQTLWGANLPGGTIAGPIVVNGCLYLATTQAGRDELLSYCT